MKTCRVCGVEKDEGHFYPSNRICKPCYITRQRAAEAKRREDPEYVERRRAINLMAHFKRAYGLSPAAYQELMEAANWQCEICTSTEILCVDHCHATGEIRGVLCKRCNNMLGQSLDSPETLRRAAAYLEKVSA